MNDRLEKRKEIHHYDAAVFAFVSTCAKKCFHCPYFKYKLW